MRLKWIFGIGVMVLLGLIAAWAVTSALAQGRAPLRQPAIQVTQVPSNQAPSPTSSTGGAGFPSPSATITPSGQPSATAPRTVLPPDPVDYDDDDDDDRDDDDDDD